MNQIRGMKVKPDSEAGSASNDAQVQTGKNVNNSSGSREPGVPLQSDTGRLKVIDRTTPKKPAKETVVRGGAATGNPATVTPTDASAAGRRGSKNAVLSDDMVEDGDGASAGVMETNAAVSATSSDKETASAVLRTCARCHKQESTLHEFKKCKK